MFTALTNSFLLEPEGLEFDDPVTIEITVLDALPSDQIPVILHTDTDGNSILLETQVNGQTLSASIEHFSRATIVIHTPFIHLRFQLDSAKHPGRESLIVDP